jgi:hypothetical protein
VDAFDEYLEGFPMIFAVTVYNSTEHVTYYGLPPFGLLSMSPPLQIVLRKEDGTEYVYEERSVEQDKIPGQGFKLEPGDRRRVLFDLGNLPPQLEAGSYRMKVRLISERRRSAAEPAPVQVREPDPADSSTAALLRTINDEDEPGWAVFIRYNWHTIYTRRPAPKKEVAEGRAVDASGLSEEGREALALHLFLHRATYGPGEVAELDPGDTEAFARGPLEGEAAVLRYEILVARDDPAAEKKRKEILEQFPGLQWRVEAIENGNGWLRRLRRMYGAEQDFTTEPDFFPYTEQ